MARSHWPVVWGCGSLKCTVRWEKYLPPHLLCNRPRCPVCTLEWNKTALEFIVHKHGLLLPLHLRDIIAFNAILLLSSLAFIESIDRHLTIIPCLFFFPPLPFLSFFSLTHSCTHTGRSLHSLSHSFTHPHRHTRANERTRMYKHTVSHVSREG